MAKQDRDQAFRADNIQQRADDAPVYISFDIDGPDPAFAPGTGAPVATTNVVGHL